MAPYRLLGDVEAGASHRPVTFGVAQRATLAMLLMSPNRYVSDDRLVVGAGIDEAVSLASLRTFVSGLRRAVGSIIERRSAGYSIVVDESEIDLFRFRLMVARAREANEALKLATASELLRSAHALWRSPALGGIERTNYYRDAAPALDEERALASDLYFSVELALGRHEECLPDLWAAAANEPLRERRWGQLMLALYRTGQHAEALRAYSRLRHRMIDELGLDPSPDLRKLESDILSSRDSLDWRPTPERQINWGEATAAQDTMCRHRELGQLRKLARSSGGRGAVIVRGEAGTGKSTLIRAFADLMRADGAVVLTARCTPDAQPPFGVLRQALDGFDHHAAASGSVLSDLAVVLPGLGGFMNDGREDFLPPSPARIVEASSTLLTHVSAISPTTTLIIEDVHWADSSTVTFLNTVLRSRARVLVVLSTREPAYRPTELPAAELHLRALTDTEVRKFWEDLTGRTLGPERARTVNAVTGGIPFYIAALARANTERTDGHAKTTITPDAAGSQRSILAQRLAGLGERLPDLLATIAVAGPPVRVYELAAMTQEAVQDLVEVLQPAIDAGLLVVQTQAQFEYDFAHDLIRDHVAATVSPARTAVLHYRAAAAISGDGTVNDLLRRWRHQTKAAGLVSPAELLDSARSVFKLLERSGAVDQAQDVCMTTLAITGDTSEVAAEMLVRLGVILGQAGRPEAARIALDRGAVAARASGAHHILIEVMRANDPFDPALSGDPQRAATVREALELLGDGATQTRLSGLIALSVAEHRQGRSTNARVLLDEATKCAAELGTPVAEAMVGHLRHLLERANRAERRDETERSRATAIEIDNAVRAGDLALIVATTADSLTDALEFGTIDDARAALHTLRAYARESDNPMPLWAAACADVVLAQGVGDLDRAGQLARTAVAFGRRNGLGLADVAFDAHRLVDGMLRGDFSRLIESLEAAAGRDPDAPAWAFAQALARARTGDLAGAQRVMDATGSACRLPDDWLRPAGLMLAGEATALASGPDDPRSLIAMLQPWVGVDLVIGTAMVSLGPVQRVTGLLHASIGSNEEAAANLIDAAEKSIIRGMSAWARLALVDGIAQAHLTQSRDLVERATALSIRLSKQPIAHKGDHQ